MEPSGDGRMRTRSSATQASTPALRRSTRARTPTKPPTATSSSAKSNGKPPSKAKKTSSSKPPRFPNGSGSASRKGRSSAKAKAGALESPSEAPAEVRLEASPSTPLTKAPRDGLSKKEISKIVTAIQNNPQVTRVRVPSQVRVVQDRGHQTLRLPKEEEGSHDKIGIDPSHALMIRNGAGEDWVSLIPGDPNNPNEDREAKVRNVHLNRVHSAYCDQPDPNNGGLPLCRKYVDDHEGLIEDVKDKFDREFFLEESLLADYYNSAAFQAMIRAKITECTTDMNQTLLHGRIDECNGRIDDCNVRIGSNTRALVGHNNRLRTVEQGQEQQGEEITHLQKQVKALSAQKTPASTGSANDGLMPPHALQYGASPSPSIGTVGVLPAPAASGYDSPLAESDKKPAAGPSTDAPSTANGNGNGIGREESVGTGLDGVYTPTLPSSTAAGASGSQLASFTLHEAGSQPKGNGPSVVGSTTGAGDGGIASSMPNTSLQTYTRHMATQAESNGFTGMRGMSTNGFTPIWNKTATAAAGPDGANVAATRAETTVPISNRSDGKRSANAPPTMGAVATVAAAGVPSSLKPPADVFHPFGAGAGLDGVRLANTLTLSSSTQENQGGVAGRTSMNGSTTGAGAGSSGQTAVFSFGMTDPSSQTAGSGTGTVASQPSFTSGNRQQAAFASFGMPNPPSQTGFNISAGSTTMPSASNAPAGATTNRFTALWKNSTTSAPGQPILNNTASSATGQPVWNNTVTSPAGQPIWNNTATAAARPVGGNVTATDETVPIFNGSNPPMGAGVTVAAPTVAQSPSSVQGAISGKWRKTASQGPSAPLFTNGASTSSVGTTWGKRRAPGSANAASSTAPSSVAGASSGESKPRRFVKARRPSSATSPSASRPSGSASSASPFHPDKWSLFGGQTQNEPAP